MEHYAEFCDYIANVVQGLNVQISGNVCGIGFADIDSQIAVTIVYSSSLIICEAGEVPEPSDAISDLLKLHRCLKPRLISSKFKLEAIDYVKFDNTIVGAGSRWQLRFRRY